LGLLESMCGLDLSDAPWGVDGCGIPTIAIPLANFALAMARLGVPDDQPDRRQAACARVRRAMSAHPRLVSGSGRFCTRVIQATAGRALVKTGAEGVYAASFPQLGLGAALKAEDGAGRAAEAAMAYLLARLDVLSAEDSAANRGADSRDRRSCRRITATIRSSPSTRPIPIRRATRARKPNG
jgi:L-asparaginase II